MGIRIQATAYVGVAGQFLNGSGAGYFGVRTSRGLFTKYSTLADFSAVASAPEVGFNEKCANMARDSGGMRSIITASGAITEADLRGKGNMGTTIIGLGDVTGAHLAGGVNLGATLQGLGEITDADIRGKGNLSATIQIGAQPSAFDIAQAVWSQAMVGFTDSAAYGGFVKKLLTLAKFLGLK